MFRKLNPWFLFIMLEVSKAATQSPDTAAPQAPGEDAPQALSTDAPNPHVPGTASNAIKTMNSFIEIIQNREKPDYEEDEDGAGNVCNK